MKNLTNTQHEQTLIEELQIAKDKYREFVLKSGTTKNEIKMRNRHINRISYLHGEIKQLRK